MTIAETPARRDHTFWIGLFAGAVVGTGLTMWLLPRASAELRQRVSDSTKKLSTAASTRVGQFARKGDSLRHDVARTIVRGAQQAERIATAIEPLPPLGQVRG